MEEPVPRRRIPRRAAHWLIGILLVIGAGIATYTVIVRGGFGKLDENDLDYATTEPDQLTAVPAPDCAVVNTADSSSRIPRQADDSASAAPPDVTVQQPPSTSDSSPGRSPVPPLNADTLRAYGDRCIDLFADNMQSTDFVDVQGMGDDYSYITTVRANDMFCNVYVGYTRLLVLWNRPRVTSAVFERTRDATILTLFTKENGKDEFAFQLVRKNGYNAYCINNDFWYLTGWLQDARSKAK
ncbi:uncharacterized protein BcabD6B2_00920 [Babesia caballi]|uniref:Membrane protein, putative n=1 Tax=Babesia caballi TaxID=5871 RepID=A0AAV4LMA7_BABCB|nr:membrane protein, putative [Babesia caballi]